MKKIFLILYVIYIAMLGLCIEILGRITFDKFCAGEGIPLFMEFFGSDCNQRYFTFFQIIFIVGIMLLLPYTTYKAYNTFFFQLFGINLLCIHIVTLFFVAVLSGILFVNFGNYSIFPSEQITVFAQRVNVLFCITIFIAVIAGLRIVYLGRPTNTSPNASAGKDPGA